MSNDEPIVRPNVGKVAVEPFPKPEQISSGGIVLPRERAPYTMAKILAVGFPRILAGGQVSPSHFKVGDIVIIQPYVGNTIIIGGQHVLVVPESDIVCRVPEGSEVAFGIKEAKS